MTEELKGPPPMASSIFLRFRGLFGRDCFLSVTGLTTHGELIKL